MPRPKKIDRPVRFEVCLPTSIHEKMKQQLFSDVEQRVPFGAPSVLVEALVTQWLLARGVEL